MTSFVKLFQLYGKLWILLRKLSFISLNLTIVINRDPNGLLFNTEEKSPYKLGKKYC